MSQRNTIIYFLLILYLIIFPTTAQSQVVVERSKDKVVISGKPYFIHIVKKGETAYSISKAYFITVDDLVKENPAASSGIREGQSLRLPVVESPSKQKRSSPSQPQKDETKYIYHRLTTGDTVFSLARRFGVSEEEILKSNPGLEINKLPAGTEIAIPRRQFASTAKEFDVPQKEYINHRVEKGESLSSIAEKYGLTVREIRKENRGLIFPKVDDYVRIPVSRIADTVKIAEKISDTLSVIDEEPDLRRKRPAGYTPVGRLRGKYNIALMLPLYYHDNSVRTEIDSSQMIKGKRIYKKERRPDSWIDPDTYPFLELYLGTLLAADTLRNLGLDINLYLYDIKQDTGEVVKLIMSGDLEKMDLIIGPVFSNNLAIVAKYASSQKIPVVSPVPLWSNKALAGHPYLFLANPSLEVAQEAISKKAADYYTGNFVFIHSDTSRTDEDVRTFKNLIFKELSEKIPYEEIKFKEFLFKSQSSLTNDSINRLEHALSDKTDNIILIASEDPSLLSETIMDVHTLSKKYSVKLLGYPKIRELVNLDPKFFFELGLELYSPFWIDYSKVDIKKFYRSFRQKFLTEPEEASFAWQGFDITYYFITGLAIHGRSFLKNPEIHNPDLLETEFDFLRLGDDNGLENHKLYLIRYTGDMEIKMVEEKLPFTEDEKN